MTARLLFLSLLGLAHAQAQEVTIEHGLTIRAYMATQIMAGIVANDRFIAGATYQGDHYLAAQNAVTAADLLIAELNK